MNTEEGLKQFTAQMRLVLDENQEEKGDSWVTCNINFLEDKLKEEFSEYQEEKKPLAKAQELVDIANICMMLYDRHLEIWAKKASDFLNANRDDSGT